MGTWFLVRNGDEYIIYYSQNNGVAKAIEKGLHNVQKIGGRPIWPFDNLFIKNYLKIRPAPLWQDRFNTIDIIANTDPKILRMLNPNRVIDKGGQTPLAFTYHYSLITRMPEVELKGLMRGMPVGKLQFQDGKVTFYLEDTEEYNGEMLSEDVIYTHNNLYKYTPIDGILDPNNDLEKIWDRYMGTDEKISRGASLKEGGTYTSLNFHISAMSVPVLGAPFKYYTSILGLNLSTHRPIKLKYYNKGQLLPLPTDEILQKGLFLVSPDRLNYLVLIEDNQIQVLKFEMIDETDISGRYVAHPVLAKKIVAVKDNVGQWNSTTVFKTRIVNNRDIKGLNTVIGDVLIDPNMYYFGFYPNTNDSKIFIPEYSIQSLEHTPPINRTTVKLSNKEPDEYIQNQSFKDRLSLKALGLIGAYYYFYYKFRRDLNRGCWNSDDLHRLDFLRDVLTGQRALEGSFQDYDFSVQFFMEPLFAGREIGKMRVVFKNRRTDERIIIHTHTCIWPATIRMLRETMKRAATWTAEDYERMGQEQFEEWLTWQILDEIFVTVVISALTGSLELPLIGRLVMGVQVDDAANVVRIVVKENADDVARALASQYGDDVARAIANNADDVAKYLSKRVVKEMEDVRLPPVAKMELMLLDEDDAIKAIRRFKQLKKTRPKWVKRVWSKDDYIWTMAKEDVLSRTTGAYTNALRRANKLIKERYLWGTGMIDEMAGGGHATAKIIWREADIVPVVIQTGEKRYFLNVYHVVGEAVGQEGVSPALDDIVNNGSTVLINSYLVDRSALEKLSKEAPDAVVQLFESAGDDFFEGGLYVADIKNNGGTLIIKIGDVKETVEVHTPTTTLRELYLTGIDVMLKKLPPEGRAIQLLGADVIKDRTIQGVLDNALKGTGKQLLRM